MASDNCNQTNTNKWQNLIDSKLTCINRELYRSQGLPEFAIVLSILFRTSLPDATAYVTRVASDFPMLPPCKQRETLHKLNAWSFLADRLQSHHSRPAEMPASMHTEDKRLCNGVTFGDSPKTARLQVLT
eukprot:1478726-Amphidinium_carterae.1